jgi:predicted nucleic acid-binding protein
LTYADSSILVSLYRPTEELSAEARRVIEATPLPVILSQLSLLEIRNAFNLAIHRRECETTEREAVFADIERQMAVGVFRMAAVSQTDIYAKARELSDRHTPLVAARSLDLMHIAAALLVKARVFLSTDIRQRKVAISEGLKVLPAR